MKIKHDSEGPRTVHECTECPEKKHTPLPWKAKPLAQGEEGYPDMCSIVANVKNEALPFAKGDAGFTIAEVEGSANAAFIVKCVNSHEMLLETLISVKLALLADDKDSGGLIRILIDPAICKAKGEKIQ